MSKDRKAKINTLPDGNKNSVVRFGIGWWPILFCLAMFYYYVGLVNDGTNIVGPAAAKALGVELPTILFLNFVAGMIGIVFFLICGQINKKIGAGKLAGILMIITGVAYFGVGQSRSLAMYLICMACVVGSIMSAGYICGGSLVAQWFPKKKGAVMGYTTMGHNLASATYCIIITATIGAFGFRWGLLPVTTVAVVLGIAAILFMRNEPTDYGINPDNVSDEVYQNEYDTTSSVEDDGGWTTKKLLTTKETWMVALTTGLFQVCSGGIMTQIVLRNVELGMTQSYALFCMTIVAIIGLCGSWGIGVLDQKFGTKRTMMLFGLWFGCALLLNFLCKDTGSIIFWISFVMIGVSIGGSANFSTSLPAAVFGRHGFGKVNSVVFPIMGAIMACNYLVNMIVQSVTGGEIRYAYLVFACIAWVNILLISTVNEHRFNRDWKAEQEKKNKAA